MGFFVHSAGIAAEIGRAAIVTIAEYKIIIEDEVEIVKQADDDRGVGNCGKAHWFAAEIDVLAPGVQRR